MRAEEYEAVAQTIVAVNPTAMLVFGVGRDSALWCSLVNEWTMILFVEDDPKWAAQCPGLVLVTHYHGTVAEWATRDPLTTMDAWALLARTEWDMILVDGPRGDSAGRPGRLGPIAFSSGCKGTVIVHDTHRVAERGLCERYLGRRPRRNVHHLSIFSPLE